MSDLKLTLEGVGKLGGCAAQRWKVIACGGHVHARFGRLDGNRRKRLAGFRHHRHRHAHDPDEIFLAIERNTFPADLLEFRLELRPVRSLLSR